MSTNLYNKNTVLNDIFAGTVVFLVALPLCLGIALASGASLMSGIIAGIIGGMVVAPISGSPLSVTGPAAGLTILVAESIKECGDFSVFLCAVILAGCVQILFGVLKLGRIGEFIPTSVINGMLAAIGVIIIIKQLPIALGTTSHPNLDEVQFINKENYLFAKFINIIPPFSLTPILISVTVVVAIITFEKLSKKGFKIFRLMPPPLIALILSILLHTLIKAFFPNYQLENTPANFVNLPHINGIFSFFSMLELPDITGFSNFVVYKVALIIAIVASIETLLSVEAVDKLDPLRRISNTRKELFAQGAGNICSGILGGIPITAVILRSSANVYAGGLTKISPFFHGLLLFFAVVFFSRVLNFIPLSALAGVLIIVGYKLASPKVFKEVIKSGKEQYLPFFATLIFVVLIDLLFGVLIGFCVGIFFVIKANHHSSLTVVYEENNCLIKVNKDLTFLHKAFVKEALLKVPDSTNVLIDGIGASYIDKDIVEIFSDFKASSPIRGINVIFSNIRQI
jgi:MFS superfamily sulfate permease-like transporter